MNRARPATVLLIGAVGLLLLAPSSASGQPAGADDWEGGDDARAVALLGRAAAALDRVSYTGTRIVSSWGRGASTTVLVDVKHVASQGTLVRMRGGADEFAEDTAAFLAGGAGERTQRRDPGVDSLQLLTASYDVRMGSPGRAAGRPAHVVELRRGARLVARVWVDEHAGLPLRREMFDSAGRLAIETAFIDLTVEDGAFIAHLPPSAPPAGAERVDLVGLSSLQDHGWAFPQQVAGLHLVGVERMESTAAVHLSYSDGLVRVSVFEQQGGLDERALDGFTPARIAGTTVQVRVGMPSYAMWEDSGTVYTVVSDAPVATVADVVASYPHADEPGFWERVGGGMGRLSAWVSPLV